ncbi:MULTISPECIES: MerR family transcriptional regulator [Niallia]|uniref:MerR family transcriptional regulator n=1 Tax=Niallia TaxID=2837506 RepID=UPI0003329B8F|nr:MULTISPECIES: MerR family transcriptional regulator [Niallia]EOR26073.1 transcriptional regulator CueR [Niallia nealsonii AAU1]MCB5238229.1 MerR family transcriptional regulator [Niallia circulans]MED3795037.1 MerR family transcriptional regulator [Niallia alba]UTI43650.1 MerR family transcriptional regulator [Niallia sp. RD1]
MKLRIGDLAKVTGVTKRTIDYYTNLGLLQAERSQTNYRYYSEEQIEQIKTIEEFKKRKLSLEEIKEQLNKHKMNSFDIEELKTNMKDLNEKIHQMLTTVDIQDHHKKKEVRNTISHESISLIQALLLLLN